MKSTATAAMLLAAASANSAVCDTSLSKFCNFGNNLANFNLGMMKSMISDPDNSDSTCVVAADETGEQLRIQFNLANYEGGSFNMGDFVDQLQISGILLMSQYNECGFNDYLVQLDQFFSKTPQLVGGISNLATQLVTGRD